MIKRRRSHRKEIDGTIQLQCNKCFSWLDENKDNFQFRKDIDGFRPVCKACLKKAKQKSYNTIEGNRTVKNAALVLNYGITHEEYDLMFKNQQGVCAICGTDSPNGKSNRFKYFSVDHCHDTGKIRGLLCNHCNRGIGMLQDSKEIVYNAYKYLKDNE